MLFNLEHDAGSCLTAYLVPDSLAVPAVISVRTQAGEIARIEANETRPSLVAAGRHPTGQCGFRIDETMVPGLAEIEDLELRDADTGLLIYRRRPRETVVHQRIFRLETHLLPLWRLDDHLEGMFHMWYKGVDRYGRESSTQVFCFDQYSSFYASGRLHFRTYEHYLGKGFKSIAMIRDPYDELAERLLVLRHIGSHAETFLGLRDAITFEPVIAYLAELSEFSALELRRLFRHLPESFIPALANPLVRQLTAHAPDEMPGHASLAAALDALSSFEIVALRSQPDAFTNALADLCGIPAEDMPRMREFSLVQELGDNLRTISALEALLEKDLELYHQTAQAFEAVSLE